MVLCARGAGAQLALGPGIIVASVHDSAGKPIAGAVVVASGPTQRTATTGSAGIVTLNALPLGTYGLRCTRSGYQPMGASVRLQPGSGPKFVSLLLDDTSFADLREPARVVTTAGGNDPFAAHVVDALPSVALVPATDAAGAGLSLEGTTPDESRVELDGIPIPGGGAGPAALRFRDALSLDRIAVAQGPFVDSPSLQDAIGGIVNYRAAAITLSPSSELAFGHDSDFGTFEHVRFSDTLGPVGFLADAVTGDGQNRTQTAKLQYALAPGVVLGFASYGSQSSAAAGTTIVQNLAPAYAADLRAKLGATTFEIRDFDSESDTSVSGSPGGVPVENARIGGLQLGFDVPLGGDSFGLTFDRRRESATFQSGGSFDQTVSTLVARTDFALGDAGRVALDGALSSGTQLTQRFDPQALFTFHPARSLTLRLAAGSGFATAPDAVLAAAGEAPADQTPETSFGYRASVETPFRGKGRIFAGAYELRRFDRFASVANARSTGALAGLDVPAAPGALGATAYLELAKTYAYGPSQPLVRYLNLEPVVPLAQLEGDPYSKARLAVTYRSTGGFSVSAGSTLLGAGNALADRAVFLGDASLRVEIGRIGAVSLGVTNAFGAVVSNPLLAPLYAPRELTLTLGR